MNDRGYGVIRNIQDARFGGRRHYADLHTPDFKLLAAASACTIRRSTASTTFRRRSMSRAAGGGGPQIVEVDMHAIGPFAEAFAGPPAGAAGST